MFSNKLPSSDDENYEKYISTALDGTYYMICLKTCIKDFSTELDGKEKVCLAKCLDRAHDYLKSQQKNISPFNLDFQKKYVSKTDGSNLLGFMSSRNSLDL